LLIYFFLSSDVIFQNFISTVSMSQLLFNVRHDGHVHEVYILYFTTAKSINQEFCEH